jgi:hypothetical protein
MDLTAAFAGFNSKSWGCIRMDIREGRQVPGNVRSNSSGFSSEGLWEERLLPDGEVWDIPDGAAKGDDARQLRLHRVVQIGTMHAALIHGIHL